MLLIYTINKKLYGYLIIYFIIIAHVFNKFHNLQVSIINVILTLQKLKNMHCRFNE
jgi:hypothetical protein